ncbi:tRNA lysidine(34) synthetase TilS [Neptuniibacter sp. PT8_73]|uniref:tRNA lysidine(34) synthetase TilS n=1 Tax=unclassified Neptuniibacter TaxID=2630693 RepID=UPI0039F6EC70
MKPNTGNLTALQECERQFKALTSRFISSLDSSSSISRWVIAHSGGLDSQLLLHLACKVLPRSQIVVLHINHNLQVEADSWSTFSERQAELHGVVHHLVSVIPNNSSEVAARDARYAAFNNFVVEGDCVLFGHHADDQAETLLFRWLRGTGLTGLKGMPEQRDLGQGYLLRPLLYCSRKQLEQAATAIDLEFIQDPSNDSIDYDRNFLRHKVLPELKQRWPQLLARWQKNADLVTKSESLLNHYLDQDLSQCLVTKKQLNLAVWGNLAEVKRLDLIRRWVYNEVGFLLNEQQLKQIQQDVIQAQSDANPIYSIQEHSLRRFRNHLYIVSPSYELLDNVEISEAGCWVLGDGELTIELAKPLQKPLMLRRRKGGERCVPHGQVLSKSVKKLLQEADLPPWVKSDWPLIFQGETVVAVPGICVCNGWDKESSGFSLLWRPLSLSD